MKAATLRATAGQWWTDRPPRERLLVCVCAAGVLFAAAERLLIAPLDKRIKQAQAQHSALYARLQQRLKQHGQQAAAVESARAGEAELRDRIRAAQVRLVALNARLQDSARLPEVLRAVTATVGGARLLELQFANDTTHAAAPPAAGVVVASAPSPVARSTGAKTPPAPLDGTVPASAAAPPSALVAGRPLYQLPISMKVSGTWDELNLLLTQVERHAQALQWHSIELDNSNWPAIELTLKAHVPSLQSRWGTNP